MSEIIKFKKTFDDTIDYSNARCDEGDYASALAALDFYAEKPHANSDVYAHIADIYLELEKYDLAIKYWFIYLIKSPAKYRCDGYNGLGANFYLKGDRNRAAYYFDMQFACNNAEECVYNDILDEFIETEKDDSASKFKIVSVGDGEADVLEKIREYRKRHDLKSVCDNVRDLLQSENTEIRKASLFEAAYAEFYLGHTKVAKNYIDELFSSFTDNDFKSNFLRVCIYDRLGYHRKATEYAKNTTELEAEDNDAYKHITLAYKYYENGFSSVENLIKKYINKYPYNSDLQFVAGIVYYNEGDYSAAEKFFARAYYYSREQLFAFYRNLAVQAQNERPEGFPVWLNFSINYPDFEEKNIIETLGRIFGKEITLSEIGDDDFYTLLDYTTNAEHPALFPAFVYAILAEGSDKQCFRLKELLVDGAISDELKRKLISLFCESGQTGKVAVTYADYLRYVQIDMPDFADRGYDKFSQSYAFALGICSIVAADDIDKIFHGALEMQKSIIKYGNVGKVKDGIELACAMCVYSSVKLRGQGDFGIYDVFCVDKKNVDFILKLTEGRFKYD